VVIAAVVLFALENRQGLTLNFYDRSFTYPASAVLGVVYGLGMLTGWSFVGLLRRSWEGATDHDPRAQARCRGPDADSPRLATDDFLSARHASPHGAGGRPAGGSALRFRLSLLMFLQYAFPGALLQLYSLHLAGLGFEPWAAGLCCA